MKKINLLSIIGITCLSLGEISYANPTIFPDGIASSAPVVNQQGVIQGTIGDTVTKAQGAIQQTEKNSANGVAGLDANGNVAAPVNTAGIINSQNKPTISQSAIYNGELDSPSNALGDILRVGRSTFTSMIDGTPIMRVSGVHRQANPIGEDNYMDPDGVLIGGFAKGRGSRLVITGQDEGGTNLGAILSVWNSVNESGGNRPGIAPTTSEEMAGYGPVLDSVVFDNGTAGTTPKLVIASNITDDTGLTHSLYFTKNEVYIYPALNSSDRGKLKQHQTIMTNISTPEYINRTDQYGAYAPNGLSGMVDDWHFGTPCPAAFQSGSCDSIHVSEWVIIAGSNTDGAGINPQDFVSNPSNLDTHYDATATVPTIYIGPRTKQFNVLYTCRLADYDTDPADSGISAQHSLYRECENGEYDDELFTTISGKYHFNGITIGVDSHKKGTNWVDGTAQTDGYNAWPDKKSWGIYLGGQLPNLMVLNPFTSDFVLSISGNTLNVTNPISTGSNPGDKALYSSEFKNSGSTTMTFNQWQQCDATTGNTCKDHSSMSWREGLRVAGTIGSMTDGAPAAYTKYGGDGSFSICTGSDVCTQNTPGGSFIVPGFISSGSAVTANTFATGARNELLADIKQSSHTEGDQVWCHDCRSPDQSVGNGTGRWISLDSQHQWRTGDGLLASN